MLPIEFLITLLNRCSFETPEGYLLILGIHSCSFLKNSSLFLGLDWAKHTLNEDCRWHCNINEIQIFMLKAIGDTGIFRPIQQKAGRVINFQSAYRCLWYFFFICFSEVLSNSLLNSHSKMNVVILSWLLLKSYVPDNISQKKIICDFREKNWLMADNQPEICCHGPLLTQRMGNHCMQGLG